MNSDKFLPLIVTILCAVGVLGFMLLTVLKRRRARHWPTAAGHVESTRVFLQERGENQSRFVAEVRYAYQVLGETHAGVLARDFFLEGRANKWLGGYPSGRALSVRVNPFKPADSVLLDREQAVPGTQPAAAGK